MRTQQMILVLFVLVALFFAGCDQLPADAPGAPDAPDATPSPAPTVAPVDPPRVPILATPAPLAEQAVTLRVWIPPQIAVVNEGSAQILSDQLFAYDVENPELELQVAQKEVSGPGGLLSYLRTGRDVAPEVMPDLIAIPGELLPVLAGENLLVPLADQVDEDALAGLFPPAQTIAQPQGTVLGYPFILTQLPHLAYNSNVLTGTLPLTWQRLIAEEDRSLVFAADGPDGAVLALQFYLDAGGRTSDDDGQPLLEFEPLLTALQQFEDGREAGFFAPQSSTLSTTAQVWQVFLSGGANIAHTMTDHYLAQMIAGLPVSYTVIPGLDRPLTPLVGSWAWAITAREAQGQAQALDLLQYLVAPTNLATWSEGSHYLPASRDALALWTGSDPYLGFARQELERAQALPVSTSGRILTVLGDAVFQVVTGSSSAEEAAEEAAAAMQAS